MVFESSKPSDWGWQEYAIIASCAVVLIAIIVLIVVFVVRRSRKTKTETYEERTRRTPIQPWQSYQTISGGPLVPQRESGSASPSSSPPSSPERPLLPPGQGQALQYSGLPYQLPPQQAQQAESSTPPSPESQYGSQS